MHNTKELIYRFTLDSIPEKILKCQEEYSKEKKYYLYQFLFDKNIANDNLNKQENTNFWQDEPYYGLSKDSAKQRMSHIKKGNRDAMTSTPIRLIADNMGIFISELLWGKEKDWKEILPALFYLVIFDALNTVDRGVKDKLSLQDEIIEVLKPSVVFSSELAKKEIAADFMNESLSFDIHDKKLAQVIFRLYQPKIEQRFYELFKQEFIDSNYNLSYLDTKLKKFTRNVIIEIEKWNSEEIASVSNSLGYQVYQTYNLYYSHEMREYRSTFNIRSDERYSNVIVSHYLDEEQQMIGQSIEQFANDLAKVQELQDKRLNYRINPKEMFRM